MHDFPIITMTATAFTAAWVLGMLTHKLGFSPIVGYLLAGVLIGPHTPGFVGDVAIATQLAEIGVILLMFGVGLHFHFRDLLAVRAIAVPGAIGQSAIATAAGAGAFLLLGLPLSTGLVIGVALAVASTVVLMRVLVDNQKLDTPEGHAAVGWLIVEDVITVLVLVLIPALAGGAHARVDHSLGASLVGGGWVGALVMAIAKLGALVGLVVLAGSRVVPKMLVWAAKQRSRELFTLTVLMLSIAVAAGSAMFFDASIALGAFLAGMVVGQSAVSQQAAADLLPLRDSFAVLFFISVGMLFDPRVIIAHPQFMLAALVIVLVIKPLAAVLIVVLLGYPAKTALTVAVGLAQIGEFSFVLSDLARKLGLMPEAGHSVLVAVAMVSITVNPLLFRSLDVIESAMRHRPKLWRILNGRCERRALASNAASVSHGSVFQPAAVIVGYGPAGRHLDRLLRESGLATQVIELNIDAVTEIRSQGRSAVFGDATQASILEQAGIAHAKHLILTMPDAAKRTEIIAAAKDLNPPVRVFARARYSRDQAALYQFGPVSSVVDEVESAVALARLVLIETGAGMDRIRDEMQRIRQELEGGAAILTEPRT